MAKPRAAIHISAIVLFSMALVLYIVGSTMPAAIFAIIGMIVEIGAWIALYAASASNDDSR